jgi:alpha-galactosidase
MGAAAVKTPTPVSNGLALTPPMGWSSWNQFGDDINEAIVTQTIDAMVANGMRDAGYVFVNLDDGWQRYKGARRDHPLEFDPVKFPRGISYLAEYAHARGMKLGIYSGPGQTTCAGYTGSIGNEANDAAMFASWGVDHLKYESWWSRRCSATCRTRCWPRSAPSCCMPAIAAGRTSGSGRARSV